jgi:hypothetical protein
LVHLSEYGSHLGDILVSQGWVDALDVFRAIRDQGRDRVAAICGWPKGSVAFYRSTAPGHVDFPLDLDLASPMMAGAIVRARGDARSLLPDGNAVINPGTRFLASTDRSERGTAPVCLQMLPDIVQQGATVTQAIERLTSGRSPGEGPVTPARTISRNEACAALYTAKLLRWVRF